MLSFGMLMVVSEGAICHIRAIRWVKIRLLGRLRADLAKFSENVNLPITIGRSEAGKGVLILFGAP